MDDQNRPTEPQLPQGFRWLWLGLVILAASTALATLNVNSLWLDELFTAYFADPSNTDFSTFLNRAAEDVHPPGYYLLVWAAGRISGLDIGLVARGISWVFVVLTLLALPSMMPPWVSNPARLFTMVFAATSLVFFIYANEGRSYALGWFLIVLLLGASLHIRPRLRSGGMPAIPILALVILGIVAGLSHYYLITITGAVVACLILSSRNWTQRTVLALAGLVILIPLLAYVSWQAPQVIADVQDTWFSADFSFLVHHTIVGIVRLAAVLAEQVIFLLLLIPGTFAATNLLRQAKGRDGFPPEVGDTTFVISIVLLAIFLTILVTLLYAPSYSFRFFLILAPAYWMLAGFLFALILQSAGRSAVLFTTLLSGFVFCLMPMRIFWAQEPYKQPWRETAQIIANMPACASAPLAVTVFDTPFISESEPARFYGYYLPPANREWLAVPSGQLPAITEMPDFRALVTARLSNPTACPVLLWSVQHAGPDDLAAVHQAITAAFPRDEETKITLNSITTPPPPKIKVFLGMTLGNGGYLIVVEHSEQN